jgi:hypothetical protein
VGWDYQAVRINSRINHFSEVVPCTEWFTYDVAAGKTIRRIQSSWTENRDKYKDVNQLLSPGWSRHDPSEVEKFRGEPMLFPDGCGQYVYKHDGMLYGENSFWYYPFPVTKIDSTTQPDMPEQIAHLFCKTQRAFVKGRRGKEDAGKNTVGLLNSAEEIIGKLRLNNLDMVLEFTATGDEKEGVVELDKLELVAVCRARIYSKAFDEEKQSFSIVNPVKTVFNVLWVQCVDGIAYRKGSGSVDEVAWEALGREDVELVLG